MNISPGQISAALVEAPDTPAKQAASNSALAPAPAPSPTEEAASATQAADSVPADRPAEPLTDVSLRLDNNGRVYYVVSDPTSGQEILEVPPKALRDVDQGIADYVKQQQSKVTSHVKVTA
jgi:hypothetical protein